MQLFASFKTSGSLLLGLTALAVMAPQGIAHFRLVEPASWLQETERGDPQKMAPCGGTSDDPGKPVIADGLFQHISKFDKEQETDVEVPSINCSRCILPVIEFMAAHGLNKDGDYTYHHYAILQIRANPYKPVDTRFPVEKK